MLTDSKASICSQADTNATMRNHWIVSWKVPSLFILFRREPVCLHKMTYKDLTSLPAFEANYLSVRGRDTCSRGGQRGGHIVNKRRRK